MASRYTILDGLNMTTDKPLWRFNRTSEVGHWIVSDIPKIQSKNILQRIQTGDRFIELSRENEWLKIQYKDCIGWVRYLVPDVKNPSGVFGNIKQYIPNKWFTQIKKNSKDTHYCEKGCKTEIHQLCWGKNEPNVCVLPHCQNKCYITVQNTKKYETQDILKELYIVSCSHSEAFGGCPSQNKFDNIINLLDKLDNKFQDFVYPITCLCKILLTNSTNVLLNPCLHSNETPIPSDCDIVIDDTLIDIKCTNRNNNISEQLQLLGYTSLLKYNKKYNMRMNNMCIINLLQCECKVYNIRDMSNNHLFEYLQLLINEYDNVKQIKKHNMNSKIIYPTFLNILKKYVF